MTIFSSIALNLRGMATACALPCRIGLAAAPDVGRPVLIARLVAMALPTPSCEDRAGSED